ncbi:hypothetical protein ScalyP_jg1048 [Parmales sp. scaly parma]|nr:hypothetical protein ScalyP_jg1048 [Parmales sp. scaly parma]
MDLLYTANKRNVLLGREHFLEQWGEKGDGVDDGIDNDNNNDIKKDKQVLLFDHDDSFAHTLKNYLQTDGGEGQHDTAHPRAGPHKEPRVLMEEKIPAFGVC